MNARIAVGGIMHETDSFSPLPTRLEDFHISRGDALLEELGLAAAPGVTLLPTLMAGAWPGGLVERGAYLALRDELLARLRDTLPVDGVYLNLHGAMEARDSDKPEADLLQAVREIVGPEAPIAISLDLHANVTPAMVDLADVVTCYRTAPHRDYRQTRQRALDLLLRCLSEGLRPQAVLIKPPLVLPGEKAVTDVEPMRTLVHLCQESESRPGMLSTALLVGCAWTDVPHVTTSVIAIAERERPLAVRQAQSLASALWERRHEFGYDVKAAPMDECILEALALPEGPVFITDSGDNPTAGAPGDVPILLARLLALGAADAVFAAIPDAAAVEVCRAAGTGASVTVSVGGKLDPITAPPLTVTGEVRFLGEGEGGALAVLRVQGVDVILTSRRVAFTTPEQFRQAGIEPQTRRLIVVKQGYLFSELRAIARHSLMALSPGFSDLIVERLPYRNLQRPVYPLDKDLQWRPGLK